MRVFLASQSPRRRELLAQIGVPFVTTPVDVDETRWPDEAALTYVQRLAREKSVAGAQVVSQRRLGPGLVIGADTVVVAGTEIFGKPRDRAHAVAQLRALSGRGHQVFTAVSVHRVSTPTASNADLPEAAPPVPATVVGSRLSRSRVWFRPLNDQAIAAYWATGEPVDKAGSYAIQGFAARFISRLEGSYSGVMGLPLYEMGELLAQGGYEFETPALGR